MKPKYIFILSIFLSSLLMMLWGDCGMSGIDGDLWFFIGGVPLVIITYILCYKCPLWQRVVNCFINVVVVVIIAYFSELDEMSGLLYVYYPITVVFCAIAVELGMPLFYKLSNRPRERVVTNPPPPTKQEDSSTMVKMIADNFDYSEPDYALLLPHTPEEYLQTVYNESEKWYVDDDKICDVLAQRPPLTLENLNKYYNTPREAETALNIICIAEEVFGRPKFYNMIYPNDPVSVVTYWRSDSLDYVLFILTLEEVYKIIIPDSDYEFVFKPNHTFEEFVRYIICKHDSASKEKSKKV